MRWRVLGKLTQQDKSKRKTEILNILLKNRGISGKKQQEEFFNPRPPLKFALKELGISAAEIQKALKRLKQAKDKQEEVLIYGDYDADGTCGTAVLWEILYRLGFKVMPYIPDRINEGYGLNIDSIKKIKKDNAGLKLIITVDQGIVAHEKIDFSRSLGLDVIITDHHQPGKTKPKAKAIIHTTKLSGAAVAWILAREIVRQLKAGKELLLRQLELVAIGTVTDLLSLVGFNRSFVFYGLEQLNQTRRVGLISLFKEAGIKKGEIGTYEIGFIIGPRLNATGRLEHALESLRLLCTKNRSKAYELSQKLGEINQKRQQKMIATAIEAREAWMSQKVNSSKLIIVDGQDWEEGIIGLAASKLVEEFYLPVIVVSRGAKHCKASARSIEGFNIIEAIRGAENLLIDAGGHPMAAGFTVETGKLNKVKQKLIEIAEQKIDSRLLERSIKLDCEVRLTDLELSFYEQLEKLEPFGVGNPRPDFVSRDLRLIDSRLMGRENQHLKLIVRSKDSPLTFAAVGFGMGEYYFKLSSEKKFDLAYSLMINEWNGERKLELKIKDIRI